jgi:hypothetical protein
MKRIELRTYAPEFRAEAVKPVLEQGLSLEAAAQRLSVPKGPRPCKNTFSRVCLRGLIYRFTVQCMLSFNRSQSDHRSLATGLQ